MPIGSFTGLSSGVDWRSMLDQIMKLEAQPLDRVKQRITTQETKKATWSKFEESLRTLQGLNTELKSGKAFDILSASVSSTSTGVTPFKATLGFGAAAGEYLVEVVSLARAESWSSGAFADSTSALGLTGDFSLNGQTVTVGSGDSLAAVRDKINNAGAGVKASILAVSSTESRLILTSSTMGAAGINYVDGAGAVGTSLGLVETVAGSDAVLKVNGVQLNRQTNQISDAISGLTLDLSATTAGESVTLSVRSDADAVSAKVKAWVDAYNEAKKFIQSQRKLDGEKRPPLYGDSGLRMAENFLNESIQPLLSASSGASITYLHEVGIQVERGGTLSFDDAKFRTALGDDAAGVKAFFDRSVRTTDASVLYKASSERTLMGTYAVNITAIATKAAAAGAGFGGTYVSVAPETLTFSDSVSGQSANVVLNNGMTTADIVQAMNDSFTASGLKLVAVQVGNDVKVEQMNYGSSAQFTVSSADAGTSQLGLAMGTYAGTNVAGTIGGFAATGNGQFLTGAAGTDVDGLQIQHTGAVTGAAGDVIVEWGIGTKMSEAINGIFSNTDSIVSNSKASIERTITRLNDQTARMEARLDITRARLERQFIKMEEMVGLFQSQGQWLTSQMSNMAKS